MPEIATVSGASTRISRVGAATSSSSTPHQRCCSSAGGASRQQRWWGVLELLVAAPTRLILVLAPVTVAISGIGVYSIVSTLLWGRLLFGVPIHIEHLLLFAVSIPVAVLSIGLLGLVLASTFVLYRSASSLS